jgi:rubrerythrin
MKKPTDIGQNRTGIATSPIDVKALLDSAAEGVPQASVEIAPLKAIRVAYSEAADPVGTMPPPASLRGAARALKGAIKGEKATVFLDLLGERLAFERTGTRLYQALLSKLDAADPHPGGPTRDELLKIHNEELAHFHLLADAIERLGGDPTVVTPSADIAGVASSGVLLVLTDSRTTLNEALKAILIAELADNDGWHLLADVAERLGQGELASQFQRALDEEEEHLARVRTWIARAIEGEVGVEEPIEPGEAAAPPPGGGQ